MKPCPFCGSVNIVTYDHHKEYYGRAECRSCGACGPWAFYTQGNYTAAAQAAWDRRVRDGQYVPPQPQVALLMTEKDFNNGR